MITQIIPSNYKHVLFITIGDFSETSRYNHNYYVNINDESDIILEECDDDNWFDYYQVIGFHEDEFRGKLTVIEDHTYIGGIYSYTGIFFENSDKIIELNSEIY